MLFLMNKTKDQISWVSPHDLYWENKMYKRKRSILKRDWNTKKTTPNIEVWPESLGAIQREFRAAFAEKPSQCRIIRLGKSNLCYSRTN